MAILSVTYLFVAVFLGMMFYICHYSVTHQQELINNSYNGRQQILIAKNVRGEIYANNGEILAQTVTDENGEERRNYPYENLFAHAVGYATHGRQRAYYPRCKPSGSSQPCHGHLSGCDYRFRAIHGQNPGHGIQTRLRPQSNRRVMG